jgi:CubicO group peptidase (beta-lactamase class C family)
VAAAPVPDATAPPARLPSEEALKLAFKGKDAKGVLALSIDGARETVSVNSDLGADRPLLVASFTKLWVAVATLRMAARGELSLDDSIKTLVPELKSKPWSDSTVRELLSHTSRVPEFDHAFYRRTDVDFTHAPATLAADVAASTEERGVWKYRNSEYAILGAILELKTGQPIGRVLEKEVFALAGLKHAGVIVKGRPADVDFTPMGRIRPENFFVAGNGYASANDLLSFYAALDGSTLLDSDSKKILFEGNPKYDRAAVGCWAYSYPLAEGGTTLLVERPGGFGNVKLVTVFAPETHRALVFWTSDELDIGKPRKKGSVAAKLAHTLLD